MFIREMSDVHLEFGYLDVPVLENEKEMVLLLPGDIGVAEKPSSIIPFIEEMSGRHRAVVMILGNHEHYKGSIDRSFDKIEEMLAEFNNVHVLENDSIVVDDVAFVGSTLWTDCNNNDPITVWDLRRMINDFTIIRTGPPSEPHQRKFLPEDMVRLHYIAVEYVFDAITKHKLNGNKVVVMTHHAPSTRSIAAIYANQPVMNGGYASELDHKIMDTAPNLWFHGHTHTSFDYMIDTTRIVCNPRGYAPRDINPEFNPNWVVEI